jgi:hypothetical protein
MAAAVRESVRYRSGPDSVAPGCFDYANILRVIIDACKVQRSSRSGRPGSEILQLFEQLDSRRSIFHGLTAAQGDLIASYIRSLNI